MYQGKRVIDTHGHISTPPHFRAYAYNLRVLRTPDEGELVIPEPAMRAALDRHLRLIDACRVDVQLLSPRPVGMMHWERPFIVDKWTRVTNDLIAKQCAMHPDRFIGVAQLPQAPDLNIAKCVDELDRVVSELGFVGALLNPDPAGTRQAPGLDREEWFPLYAKAEALNATSWCIPRSVLTHVSNRCLILINTTIRPKKLWRPCCWSAVASSSVSPSCASSSATAAAVRAGF